MTLQISRDLRCFTGGLIGKCIIGWCPASRVLARPRNDDEFIAIMLKDNTWCHLPTWAIKDECEDNVDFWNFEGLVNNDSTEPCPGNKFDFKF